ncbi:hypothetical protein MBVR141_0878 [Mycoplasmopsis bovirhinis]|uniref:Putative bifunctional signaling protein/50S ribosomal protein L9 n=1 Tax=Mycoplasmopsis bovirhinis TaxID=29553 RepID=A0A224AT83_9BACT|nr:DHH family phosphoesterase [Mycoplasmopsis bovirhinis]BBA22560.1 hypothetical protein MBVR141_0878 [Mycoplasmopsis bovirhinis]VEU63676.1 putative bifunctional signaling protein/50S ribosomal protein L9 [Mycoplasmopsis bovirhinis]
MKFNKKSLIWAIPIALVLFFSIILIIIFVRELNNRVVAMVISLAILAMLAIAIILIYNALVKLAKNKSLVDSSFNKVLYDVLDQNNIGLCIYNTNHEIIWSTNYIKNTFGHDFIGQKIHNMIKALDPNLEKGNLPFDKYLNLRFKDSFFQLQIFPSEHMLIFRNVTSENLYKAQAQEQMPVLGEIEIDNYPLYQSILSEEQLFKINSILMNTLNEYSQRYNFIYRQYTNGKFLIFTNEDSIHKLIQENFRLFFDIKSAISDTLIKKLTISGGFSYGWVSLKQKIEKAKKGLTQAQARGGDQIAIHTNYAPVFFLGSNTEVLKDNSKTRIRYLTEQLEEKLLDPEINNVFIYGHSFADLDAIGSAYALYELIKHYQKEVYIIANTFDATTTQIINEYKLNKSKIIFDPSFAIKHTNLNSLVILTDVADPLRTDNPKAIDQVKRDNIFIFDHHRLLKQIDFALKTNCYIETTSSSACEIVTEIIMFLENKFTLSKLASQMLLNGIFLDTSQFSKSVTPRTFNAASWLQGLNASSSKSVEALKIDSKTKDKIQLLIANITEIKKGYYLAYSDLEATNDEISIAANEILRIKGRIASFVVAKLATSKNTYKLSARGINTNVQIICEAVGGGGHFNTAAATSDEELNDFVDNIKHAIATTRRLIKYESNTN